MIVRVAIAFAGAIIVTSSLLLGMDTLTSLFDNESGERYFRITDVLPKPEPGRPQRPEAAARQPQRPEQEFVNPDTALPIVVPAAIDTQLPAVRRPEIELPDPPRN